MDAHPRPAWLSRVELAASAAMVAVAVAAWLAFAVAADVRLAVLARLGPGDPRRLGARLRGLRRADAAPAVGRGRDAARAVRRRGRAGDDAARGPVVRRAARGDVPPRAHGLRPARRRAGRGAAAHAAELRLLRGVRVRRHAVRGARHGGGGARGDHARGAAASCGCCSSRPGCCGPRAGCSRRRTARGCGAARTFAARLRILALGRGSRRCCGRCRTSSRPATRCSRGRTRRARPAGSGASARGTRPRGRSGRRSRSCSSRRSRSSAALGRGARPRAPAQPSRGGDPARGPRRSAPRRSRSSCSAASPGRCRATRRSRPSRCCCSRGTSSPSSCARAPARCARGAGRRGRAHPRRRRVDGVAPAPRRASRTCSASATTSRRTSPRCCAATPCARRAAAGPVAVPTHKLVPVVRWELDVPPDGVVARNDPDAARSGRPGAVLLVRTKRLIHDPGYGPFGQQGAGNSPVSAQAPPRGLRAPRPHALLRDLHALLSRGVLSRPCAWRRRGSRGSARGRARRRRRRAGAGPASSWAARRARAGAASAERRSRKARTVAVSSADTALTSQRAPVPNGSPAGAGAVLDAVDLAAVADDDGVGGEVARALVSLRHEDRDDRRQVRTARARRRAACALRMTLAVTSTGRPLERTTRRPLMRLPGVRPPASVSKPTS